MLITIFTPTYNRAYTLRRLYNSLVAQSHKNFEWLIINDGSTDNTKELIEEFKSESLINIRYYEVENGGKHRAINKGLDLARGELFFIVDSDDYLLDNAIELINKSWLEIRNNDNFCGISFLKAFPNKNIIGNSHKEYFVDCNIIDYRYRHNIKGDKAEVFVTKILRNNKFPEIDGEKFISESIVWNKIGSQYLMRWVNEIIYICEYLPDGLSSKITKLRIENINGTLLYYKTNVKYNKPLKYQMRDAINYYRFLLHSGKNIRDNMIEIGIVTNLFGLVGGFFMMLRDKRSI